MQPAIPAPKSVATSAREKHAQLVDYLVPSLVVLAGLAAYHNSFSGPFIFDDMDSIQNNPYIRQLWPLSRALSAPPESPLAGRPVASLSFALNYALGGLDVRGYHAVNVLLHILNGLLLLGIAQRTFTAAALSDRYGKEARWLALAATLIWIVHPLLTDAVTYVTQRTELLMALFLLSTLYAVIRGSAPAGNWGWYAVAVACCALGMATKEVMVSAPFIVLLYDRAFLSQSLAEAIRRRWGLYAALAATWMIVIASVATGHRAQSAGIGRLGPLEYAATQCGVILHYLTLSVWPSPLSLDYSWSVGSSAASHLPSVALILLLLGATAWAVIRRPALGFLAASFFLILAPTSSFVPIATEIVAERRMYLPLACVVLVVLLVSYAFLRRAIPEAAGRGFLRLRAGAVLVLATVLTLTYLTVRRNEDYRSEVAIWSDTVAKQPMSVRARINLGDVLRKQGRTDEAVVYYSEAVRLNPKSSVAQNNLGLALADQGRPSDAIEHYLQALETSPNDFKVHNNLGSAFSTQGKLEQAMTHYRQALRINPKYAKAHFNLGLALERQGDAEQAMTHYREAVRIDPGYAKARRAMEGLQRRRR